METSLALYFEIYITCIRKQVGDLQTTPNIFLNAPQEPTCLHTYQYTVWHIGPNDALLH